MNWGPSAFEDLGGLDRSGARWVGGGIFCDGTKTWCVGSLPETNSKFAPWQWMVEIQAFPFGIACFQEQTASFREFRVLFRNEETLLKWDNFRKHGNGIQWLYWIYNSWRKLFFPASMRYCRISNILEPARHWEDVWRCSVHFREGLLINLADSGCIFGLAGTEGAGFRRQTILTSSW